MSEMSSSSNSPSILVVGLITMVALSDNADFALIKAVIISTFKSVSRLNSSGPVYAPVLGIDIIKGMSKEIYSL